MIDEFDLLKKTVIIHYNNYSYLRIISNLKRPSK